MIVFCVSNIRWDRTHSRPAPPLLTVGSEYMVVDVRRYPFGVYYQLAGFDSAYLFNAMCFATLPSESEEVAIEAESEGLIYQR